MSLIEGEEEESSMIEQTNDQNPCKSKSKQEEQKYELIENDN